MKPLPAAHNLNDQLPVLEDADSIQIAIMRLLRFLMKGPIDRKDISTLLYGLQLASTNLARQHQLVGRGTGPYEARAGAAVSKPATTADEMRSGCPVLFAFCWRKGGVRPCAVALTSSRRMCGDNPA